MWVAERRERRGSLKEPCLKLIRLLCLCVVGLGLGSFVERSAHAQALPPGEEAQGEVVKRPPFAGLGLELSTWDQTVLWAGGGAYRNDLGILILPSWAIGKRFIGHGPFNSLSLSLRFALEVPFAGVEESQFTSSSPPSSTQQPCAVTETGGGVVVPRCDYGNGPRRADYSDLSLILANPRIYTLPVVGVHVDPLLGVILPASAESRFATLVTQVLLQVGLGKELWKDRVSLGYSFGFGKGFYRYNSGVPNLSNGNSTPDQQLLANPVAFSSNFYGTDDQHQSLLCSPGEPTCTNPSFFLQNTFRVSLNITRLLSATLLYRISDVNFANRTDCMDTPAFDGGPPVATCSGPAADSGSVSNRTWRDTQLFWASVAYQALPWLGVSLSYITATPFWKYATSTQNDPSSSAVGDGQSTRSYRQGLWSADANAFTTVSLGVSVSVEGLASSLVRKN